MDNREQLLEWYRVYSKHQDMIKKQIQSIEESKHFNEKILKITYKTKEEYVLAFEQFSEFRPEMVEKEKYYAIIILNTKENIKQMISNWKTISEYPNIKLYFVNIQIQPAQRWIIWPHVHNKIADDGTLEEGIMAIAENTPLVE